MRPESLELTVTIPYRAALAYWKAGMLPADTLAALARALDRKRPAELGGSPQLTLPQD